MGGAGGLLSPGLDVVQRLGHRSCLGPRLARKNDVVCPLHRKELTHVHRVRAGCGARLHLFNHPPLSGARDRGIV